MSISPGFDGSTESDEVSRVGWSVFDLVDRLNDGMIDFDELTDGERATLEHAGFELPVGKAYKRKFGTVSEAARYAANMRWHGSGAGAGPKDGGPKQGGRTVGEWSAAFDAARKSGEPIDGLDELAASFDFPIDRRMWLRDNAASLGLDQTMGESFRAAHGWEIMDKAMSMRQDFAEAQRVEIARTSPQRATMLQGNLADHAVSGVPVIAVNEAAAHAILADGRFKSQFETQHSGGLYSPAYRAAWETATFGTHPDVNPDKRHIYGYVAMPGMEGQSSVTQYGSVRFVLDRSQINATMTLGDSLGQHVKPIPIQGFVDDHGAVTATSPAWVPGDYTEMQIAGPVPVSAIKHAHLTRPDPVLELALKEAGIPYTTRSR